MGKYLSSKKNSIVLLLLFILLLPLLIDSLKKIQVLRGKASFVKPNLVIDVDKNLGGIEYPWQALAQGGEVNEKGQPLSFKNIIPNLISLKPRFIRIDHIYDIYTNVKKTKENKISVDFSLLDQSVDDILATGAVPFLSLSYMPPAISENGDIIGKPTDWNLWKEVVAKTIEHYSGVNNRNLQNIYYEVWNEPDIFGNWLIGGNKDYRDLYKYAIMGASSVSNVNNFYIGGPAITHPTRQDLLKLNDFISFVDRENLRLDFLSWHRYTFYPSEINSEIDTVNDWLSDYPKLKDIPKFITEWGPDSENNSAYDSSYAAIYTLYTATYLSNRVSGIFSFEIKDGISPLNKQYWGRWGIFTNDSLGLVAKPRYQALEFLNSLRGELLSVSGEGTYVRALATKDNNLYQIMIVNYYPPNTSTEQATVPFSLKNLSRGIYLYKVNDIFGKEITASKEKIAEGFFGKILQMPPNSAYLVTLSKEGEYANFDKGRFGENDFALVLDNSLPKINYQVSQDFANSGSIEFWLKFSLPASSFIEQSLFEIPLSPEKTFAAKKLLAKDSFGSEIAFGFFDKGEPNNTISGSVTSWKQDEWHHVIFSWDTSNFVKSFIRLYLDGILTSEKSEINPFKLEGNNLTIGGFLGVIDELRISTTVRTPEFFTTPLDFDSSTLFLRHFNNKIDE